MLYRTHLVVGAVGARYKLSELLIRWEPRLEVVLLDGSVVQLSGDDVDHAVGETQALVELFGRLALLDTHTEKERETDTHRESHTQKIVGNTRATIMVTNDNI